MTRKEKILKLVTYINCLNQSPKETDPEYIYTDALIDDDYLLDVLLKIDFRHPMYLSELAERIEKSVEETAEIVERLATIGFIEYEADEDGVDRFTIPVFLPGIMEMGVMKLQYCEDHPEIMYAFQKYAQNLTDAVASVVPMGKGLCRAIPVEKAIKNDSRKVEKEEISYFIDKYYPSIALQPCQCRRTRRYNGEGAHSIEGEWCISLGYFAEHCIRTNRGRRLTKEETYEIIQKAEDLGYVHNLTNIYGPEESCFICNCEWSTCLALRTGWYCNSPNLMATNYRATVNPMDCVACGQCVEVCPTNAAKLGQRICEKVSTEIKPAPIPGMEEWKQSDFRGQLLTERKYVVETGTSPCKTACPAHIAVQGYIKFAAQGKYREALELIKKENPLPAICGNICNHRCEDDCTRGAIDEAVAIDEIKKFIAEQELNADTRYIPKKEFDEGKKIAVIGSGPAGLSCAYYLAIMGHQVTVFEKEKKIGGMLALGIPSFRLEKSIIDAEVDVLKELGVKFITGAEVGKYITIQELRVQGYEGFYVAIGAQGGRKLGIEGEDAKGVVSGIEFLKSINSGDTKSISGKTVIIGGGNVALDVARSAVRLTNSPVSIYCLEQQNEMPASTEELEDTVKEGITINNGWGPKRILMEEGKAVGVEFKRCTSVFNVEGKFAPVYDENDIITVECENVFVAIGQSIEWGSLLDGTNVELNKNRTAKTVPITEVKTDLMAECVNIEASTYHLDSPFEVYQTAEPDIFVGGDVYSGPKFAIDAIAAGKEAAESLHRYVWKGHSLVLGRDRRNIEALDKDNADLSTYDTTPRQRPILNAANAKNFHDLRLTFTEEQVKKETARCLGCGSAMVDQNLCWGCGICTTRCKFDAIKLEKKYDEWGLTYEELLAALS